jgi:hypothetical protein
MAEPRTINDPTDNSGARVINGALQVTGSISTSDPSVGPVGNATPGNATFVGFGNATGNLTGVSTANPLPITGTISASNPSVSPTATPVPGNATLVGFSNAAGNLTPGSLGNNTAANSLSVVVATNQAAIPVNANVTGGNVVVTGNVVLPANITANVTSVPANMTVQVTNTPAVTVSSGNIVVTGNVVLPANITANVTGPVAGNSTVGGQPVQVAFRALSAESVPNGNNTVVQPAADLVGKTITSPYANKENMLRGNVTVANTTAANLTGLTTQSGFKIYNTAVQAFRTDAGATLVYITINDTGNTTVPLPPNGGAAVNYPIPLVLAANTTANVTLSANVTSVLVNAQGYFGT